MKGSRSNEDMAEGAFVTDGEIKVQRWIWQKKTKSNV